MPILALKDISGYAAFDEEQCRQAGMALRHAFDNAKPFQHLVLDDFIDAAVLDRIAQNLPAAGSAEMIRTENHRLKRTWHPNLSQCATTRNLFAELNSQAFLAFLAEATGLPFLIPDPYYDGSGLHEVLPGGRLGIHADFNMHSGMKVHRRINLLIYLNHDWQDAYGGHLEFWDRKMKARVAAIAPVFGRAVIFATNLDAFHGHPDPLACPSTTSRRSLSQYYFSSPERSLAHLPKRSALWARRKGTADKIDWQTHIEHFVVDLIPPILYRGLRAVHRRRLSLRQPKP
jgi:hypothetical protein